MRNPFKKNGKNTAEDMTPEQLEAWKEKHKLAVDTEGLAVPEIHVGDDHKNAEPAEDVRKKEAISYDDLAVPEVHYRREK